MKMSAGRTRGNSSEAFALVEVLCSIVIAAVLFSALYAGIGQGFAITQVARENLRATQILQDRMERIRTTKFEDINALPTTFTEPYYAADTQSTGGLWYTGRVTVTNAPMTTESYGSDHRLVIINLSWNSGDAQRQRQMSTLVSFYGLHNYAWVH